MREDGAVTYFFVQHQDSQGQWTESALAHFLFDGLSSDEARGWLGDQYRALMEPQGANSSLWQKYGIHGYVERSDAEAVLRAVRERHLDRSFRVVQRIVVQVTTP